MLYVDEQWASITNSMLNGVVENRYMISNYGLIKNIISGEIISGSSLMACDGRSLKFSKARLVYMAFVNPVIPKGHKILFIDNNSNNLYYKNLICVSHSEFKKRMFENNAIANANMSFAHMSSREFYNSSQKILCYPIDEQWKDITNTMVNGINPWYLISQYGRIYSKATDSIIKQSTINSGYKRVQLMSINGGKIDLLVHRLVAMAWVLNDDPINKTCVNHIDENTFNNNANNLEWVTPLENQLYSANIQKNIFYKEFFTNEQVIAICEALQNKMDYMSICFYVLHCNYDGAMHKRLWRIHKRESHINISKDYVF